jgi:rubrerythrin
MDQPISPAARVRTHGDLREHLQWAIEVEHATIPPYLCALYSLDQERNPEVADILRSVFIEEMLHLVLAANLLNAVGGRPRIDTPEMLSPYPRPLPHTHSTFDISLLPFSLEALELFLKIEQPSARAAPENDRYETIGQLYDAIEYGMRELCAQFGERNVFCGDPKRQVTEEVFASGAGRIIVVDSLSTALTALEEIVVQGEGARGVEVWDGFTEMFHPEHDEVGHYFRFEQLKRGRCYRRGDTVASGPTGHLISIDWEGVRPMRPNPRTADNGVGGRIRSAQNEFNLTYCRILQRLEQSFDGNPEMLQPAVGAMFRLKGQANALMQIPTEDGRTTAGPSFEYVAPADR